MGARLSEDELQRALDFCVHLFSPTTPEQHESVRRKLMASQYMLEEEDDEDDDAPSGLPDHTRQDPTEPDAAGPNAAVDRLMDVRAPLVDPGALARVPPVKVS